MKYEKIMDINVCKAMKIPHFALSDELRVRVRVFNATVNTISAISWQSVSLVEEIRVPGENSRKSLTKFIT
jgi:hypothetical protein